HGLVCGTFLVLLLGSFWVRRGYATIISDSILLWSFLLFLVVLCAFRFIPRPSALMRGLLGAIVIYPSVSYPAPIVKIHEGDYFAEENLRSHRVLQEMAKIKDIGTYRVIVRDSQLSPEYWSMNAAYYGLRTFQAFMNPLPFKQMQEMFAAPYIPR